MKNYKSYFNFAISLAKDGLGVTFPNPSVGAVVVNNSQEIVGYGATGRGGRPHAEAVALDMAGAKAKGASLYVTLEPCTFTGKTPPCVDRIINSGIKKVYIGCLDPHKKVSGKGIELLRQSGLEVELAELNIKEQCLDINKGFFKVVNEAIPFVTLKLAISKDGKIGLPNQQVWLSGELARRYAHLLRAQNEAIMIGSTTAIIDDPRLDCRLEGLENRSPIRVIIKGDKEIPVQPKGTYIYEKPGSMKEVLEDLAQKNVTRILVEGGARLAKTLMLESLVDEIILIESFKEVGDQGIDAGLDLSKFRRVDEFVLDQDKVICFKGCK